MPTYDYECTRCGHKFEVFQSITAKPLRKSPEPCPECGVQTPVRRLIGTGAGVLFKGSGFYETDYRSENYKKAAKAETESSGGTDKAASEKSSGNGQAGKKETAKADGSNKAKPSGNSKKEPA